MCPTCSPKSGVTIHTLQREGLVLRQRKIGAIHIAPIFLLSLFIKSILIAEHLINHS
jgi:hypothetical protein